MNEKSQPLSDDDLDALLSLESDLMGEAAPEEVAEDPAPWEDEAGEVVAEAEAPEAPMEEGKTIDSSEPAEQEAEVKVMKQLEEELAHADQAEQMEQMIAAAAEQEQNEGQVKHTASSVQAAAIAKLKESKSSAQVKAPEVRSALDIDGFSPAQAAEDLKIQRSNIDESMVNQAALYGHYAAQATRLQFRADRAKNQIELIEAQVDYELRADAADKGEKVTEAALTKAVARDNRVHKAKIAYAEARQNAAYAKELLEAFKMRRDMLVQIGKDRREELLGDMRVTAAQEQMQGKQDRALAAMGK